MPDEDLETGAAEHGAVFAPTSVRAALRPPIVAWLVLLAVGGVIAVAALAHLAPAASNAVTAGSQGPASTPVPQAARPSRPPAHAALLTPASGVGSAGIIDLDVRPAGAHLFVHGDVFSLEVARVTIRLEGAAGELAATKSVTIPGGSTAFRIGAEPRFDVHFILAEAAQADGFVVSVTALDAAGVRLTTVTQRVGG